MEGTIARAFAEALGRKDAAALKGLLRPDVDFKALTPRRLWEASGADVAVDEIMLGTWFSPSDDIVAVEAIETGVVGARQRAGYRFRVENPDGRFVVEQQAYLEADGDRVGWVRVVCAGYQPDDRP